MDQRFPESFGPYTLLQQVAVGGMAEILLAMEERPDAARRFVTIKRIRPEYEGDPDFIEFFLSEGLVSLRCSHPNLTRAFDLDQVGDVNYLAMEYIRGHTLLDVIRKSYERRNHLSVPAVLYIVKSVAQALEYLHTMRDDNGNPMHVIHRDVTPQNIMIDATGAVKLIDLGIARSDVQVHQTQAGTVKGKFSYMAPEQLISKGPLDHRCDLFALGIVLYETLSNRGLFRGTDDRDTVRRVRKMPIPRVAQLRSDMPGALDDIIAKALERKPENRYQSATDFIDALYSLGQLPPNAQQLCRDEVLALCGDPPVPILGGDAFAALKSALHRNRSTDEREAEQEDEQQVEIDYFVERAGLNVDDLEGMPPPIDQESEK